MRLERRDARPHRLGLHGRIPIMEAHADELSKGCRLPPEGFCHPAGHFHRITVERIHLASHPERDFSTDSGRGTRLNLCRCIEANDAVARALTQHFRQESRAVACRAAADVISRIDQHDGKMIGFQGQGNRSSRIRQLARKLMARFPNLVGQPIRLPPGKIGIFIGDDNH